MQSTIITRGEAHSKWYYAYNHDPERIVQMVWQGCKCLPSNDAIEDQKALRGEHVEDVQYNGAEVSGDQSKVREILGLTSNVSYPQKNGIEP